MSDIGLGAPDGASQKRKRPFALNLLILLLLLRVILVAGLAVALFLGVLAPENVSILGGILTITAVLALAGFALLLLAAAIGLWLLRPWAWQLNLIIMGVLLVIGIWAHFTVNFHSIGNDLTLALNILIVFYLVQGDVRKLFDDART